MADADLERFHDGYRRHLDDALAEINGGRKRTHWMWFIFPQVAGLGTSPTAIHYAVRDRAEADAFVRDPILGSGYRALVDAVWRQVIGGVTLRKLFGRPDDHKLVSSLTLFAGVADQLGGDLVHDRRSGQRGPRACRDSGPRAVRDHATIPCRCSTLTPPRSSS